MKKALPFLVAVGLLASLSVAGADQIVKPHTFTAGTPANADQVNADFDVVYGQVNTIGAAITVDAVNNVGIGTATPSGELHVTKPQVTSEIVFSGVSVGNNLTVDATAYNGTGTTSYVVRVQNGGPSVDVIEYSFDGGATWSAPINMNVSSQHVGNNVMIGFSSTDGHSDGDQWEWSVTRGYPDGLIVSGGKVTVQDLTITTGAADGQVLTSDAFGHASWQVSAPDGDNDPTNELQTLKQSGTDVTLSLTGSVISVADNDNDPANELQSLILEGNTLTLSSGSKVEIDPSDTNELNISVGMSGTSLDVIDGGGTKSVDLAEKLSINNLSDAKSDGSSIFLGEGVGASDNGNTNLNVAIGKYAFGANTIGERNTTVGAASLAVNTTGSFNVANGLMALGSNTSGNYNTSIGANSGSMNQTGSGNVFLGYGAGYEEAGSNKLYIDNSATIAPLIYGDFDANYLTVNGNLESTGHLMSGGSMSVVGNSSVGGYAIVGGSMDIAGNVAIGNGAAVSTTTTLNVRGDTDDAYTGYVLNQDTDGPAYGLWVSTSGVSEVATRNSDHYGVYAEATGQLVNYGVAGSADDPSAITNIGVRGYANGGGTNYGLYGYVYDTSATTNYGIYGYASGGTTDNYAGYFDGNARVKGLLQYGTIAELSDERLKENIKPVENALAKVQGINGVYFNMKDNPSQTQVGVIAQDVQKVLPEAVSVIDKENGYLGVSYPSLIPLLIEAVKELKSANEAKDTQIAILLGQSESLKNLVCQDHPEAGICQ